MSPSRRLPIEVRIEGDPTKLREAFGRDEHGITYHPLPGERCWTCHRRVPKKRQSTSPDTKRVVAVLPPDRAEALTEGLDNLQEFVGADGESYPRGLLLELLLALGAQHREELKAYFEGRE